MTEEHPSSVRRVASSLRPGARLLILLAAAACGGWCFEHIGSPLPWMIGPLIVTAILCASNVFPVKVPNRLRPVGQVVVSCQVGLTFTVATLERLVDLAPAIVSTAVATMLCIFAVSIVIARTGEMTLAQSFLSSVPTSPVEAASMAVEHGVDPVPVIISQTLRLSAVVVVVPLAIYAIEGWPSRMPIMASAIIFDPLNTLMLLICGFAAMYAFRLLRIPNPNFLGPLTVTAALALTDYAPDPFPPAVLATAQVILGSWLGSTFRREFLGSAGRMAVVSLISILSLLLLCSLCAVGMALLFDLDWRLVLLGAAPGGVSEMVLTAKYLGQTASIVTAFHLARIFMFIPNIPWIVALLIRHERRHSCQGERD